MRTLGLLFVHPRYAVYFWSVAFLAAGLASLATAFVTLRCGCALALVPLGLGLLSSGAGALSLLNRLSLPFLKAGASTPQALARGDIAMLGVGLLWIVAILALVLAASGQPLQTVVGRPVEMRTYPSVKVRMRADGPMYVYSCGGKHDAPCQNLDDLQALGRAAERLQVQWRPAARPRDKRHIPFQAGSDAHG